MSTKIKSDEPLNISAFSNRDRNNNDNNNTPELSPTSQSDNQNIEAQPHIRTGDTMHIPIAYAVEEYAPSAPTI